MSGVRRSLHDRGGRGDTADRLRAAAARGSGAKTAVAVRSPEVTAALVLLAGIAAAALAGPAMAAAGGELLRSFFARAALAGGGAELTGLLPEAALGHVARMGLPLVVAGLSRPWPGILCKPVHRSGYGASRHGGGGSPRAGRGSHAGCGRAKPPSTPAGSCSRLVRLPSLQCSMSAPLCAPWRPRRPVRRWWRRRHSAPRSGSPCRGRPRWWCWRRRITCSATCAHAGGRTAR